jgi:hypothetical protein
MSAPHPDTQTLARINEAHDAAVAAADEAYQASLQEAEAIRRDRVTAAEAALVRGFKAVMGGHALPAGETPAPVVAPAPVVVPPAKAPAKAKATKSAALAPTEATIVQQPAGSVNEANGVAKFEGQGPVMEQLDEAGVAPEGDEVPPPIEQWPEEVVPPAVVPVDRSTKPANVAATAPKGLF